MRSPCCKILSRLVDTISLLYAKSHLYAQRFPANEFYSGESYTALCNANGAMLCQQGI